VVSDTGCGIAADVLPYVFDRFRQADSTASPRHGGLGLCLAPVKHLVELHGGTVRAESPGGDRGAPLVVPRPGRAAVRPAAGRREHPPARRAHPPVAASSIAGLRLLVVDDDPEALDLLARLFAANGAEVTTARSAAEGLERLIAERPDVLICDVGMPG